MTQIYEILKIKKLMKQYPVILHDLYCFRKFVLKYCFKKSEIFPMSTEEQLESYVHHPCGFIQTYLLFILLIKLF